MAEAEQEIDIGGPRTDPVQLDQLGVRHIGIHVADRIEIDLATRHRLADLLDRLDLVEGEAKPPQLVGPGEAYRVMMKRIERREQLVADGGRSGGRKLLPADDRAEPLEARFTPAERKCAGFLRSGNEPGIALQQFLQPGCEIGVGVEEGRHRKVAHETRCRQA
jgi:hypothetical protein